MSDREACLERTLFVIRDLLQKADHDDLEKCFRAVQQRVDWALDGKEASPAEAILAGLDEGGRESALVPSLGFNLSITVDRACTLNLNLRGIDGSDRDDA